MKKLSALLFCLLLLTQSVWAQKAGVTHKRRISRSPTVAHIIERYIDAVGGRERLLKVATMHMKMEFTIDGGLTNRMETFYKAPNKMLNIIKAEGSPPSLIGFDGKRVWTSDGGGGKAKYDSTINAERFKNADQFGGFLDFKKAFPTSRYLGVRTVGGAKSYAIEVTASGEKTLQTIYFDQKTGLMLRSDSIIPGSYKNKGVIVLYYEAYREVDGIKTPFKFRSLSGSRTTQGTYSLMEYNIALDDSIFDLPPEN